jgi:hemerythrin superfamily protein
LANVFPTGANEQWADLNMFNELLYCKGVILPYLHGFTGATDYSMTNKYDNCDTNNYDQLLIEAGTPEV